MSEHKIRYGTGTFPPNKHQAEVRESHSIVFFGELWDIGIPVVKWYDAGGYNGYNEDVVITSIEDRKTGKEQQKTIKGKRYGGGRLRFNRKSSDIKAIMLHHTGGYLPGTCFNTLHNERGLSVQFIVDDFGVIYQTMDCKEIAWHGGRQNRRTIGIECCLRPDAKKHPTAYSLEQCKRYGLNEHEMGVSYTQGKSRKVYIMPDVQVENLDFLIAGTWLAIIIRKNNGNLLRAHELRPAFPINSDLLPYMDFSEDHKKHEGLLMHCNTSPGKWDTVGVDPLKIEENVWEILKGV